MSYLVPRDKKDHRRRNTTKISNCQRRRNGLSSSASTATSPSTCVTIVRRVSFSFVDHFFFLCVCFLFCIFCFNDYSNISLHYSKTFGKDRVDKLQSAWTLQSNLVLSTSGEAEHVLFVQLSWVQKTRQDDNAPSQSQEAANLFALVAASKL